MQGHQTYYSQLGKSKFKNGIPDGSMTKISAEIKILSSPKGYFIAHNNGMKELKAQKLGIQSTMLTESDEGMVTNWVIHFSEKNSKNQFLVTATRTRSSMFFVSTMHMWGWADIIRQ